MFLTTTTTTTTRFSARTSRPLWTTFKRNNNSTKLHPSRKPQSGLTTPVPDAASPSPSSSPFYFASGYAGWPKRPPRPFPPPFFSTPSGSFSDPLSTHHRSVSTIDGQMIRGVTNGDDAMLVSETLMVANDGVGAWHTREKGCAPLWSRLIAHYLAIAAERDGYGRGERGEGGGGGGGAETGGYGRGGGEGAREPDMVGYLDEAYRRTKEALSEPNHEWLGTTTVSAALLHCTRKEEEQQPVLYVMQLGDCRVMVVRPKEERDAGDEKEDNKVVFSTKEQWHYFDCPRQLGTNSPDTPEGNGVLDKVDVMEEDIILAMSDGVTDNLWEVEIADYAVAALQTWKAKCSGEGEGSVAEAMKYVAQEIVLSARKIAEDPFAASPFMEKAAEEGLAVEGGKMDDISVVAAMCRRRKG